MDLILSPETELIGEVRQLEAKDRRELKGASEPPATKRLRANHHAIARLLAAGVRPVEISERLGVAQTTISLLERSAPFKELLTQYQGEMAERTFDLRERLELAATLTVDRLVEVLAESGDVDPDFLRKTMVDLLDRTGYPAVKQVNSLRASVGLSSEDVAAIRERYHAAQENGASERIQEAQIVSEDRSPARMGEIVPLFSSCPDEADGSAGEGEGV